MPAAVARSKGQRVINVYGFSFPPPSSLFVCQHIASSLLCRSPRFCLSFCHRSLIPSSPSRALSLSLSLTHSRSFKYTQRGTSCGLFVLYTRTLRFLSVALLQTYACTRAHTNATRSTVKRRRDEKSPATGFHEPANRPQNLAGAQKNRLLFILSLVLSF